MNKSACFITMILLAAAFLSTGCGNKKSVSKDEVVPFTIPGDLKGAVKADLNGDGSEEEIAYEKIAGEYISEELILTIDGNKYDLTEGMYFFPEDELKCFGITKNDADKSRYLYIQQTAENDYRSVSIYRNTGDKMEYVKGFDGAVDFRVYSDGENYEEVSLTDPENFLICCVEHSLGTLSTTERCRVGDDGCPVPIEDYRYFITGQNRNIVTKNEIPVGYFENESTTKESPDTLPAGQKVIPLRSDGSTFVDVKAEGKDGIYRIYYKWEDSAMNIIDNSGSHAPVDFFESFDGLEFAG